MGCDVRKINKETNNRNSCLVMMSFGGAGNTNNEKDMHKSFGGTKWVQHAWEVQMLKWNISIKFVMVIPVM
jgi:hypothetical protein